MRAKTRLFVYGTLKPGGLYHDQYCGNFQLVASEARVKGQLFEFPGLHYPGAQEENSQWIHGVILTFFHSEKVVLAELDKLEGYDPDRPVYMNEYYRKQVQAFPPDSDDSCLEVWCYFMEPGQITALKGKPISDGIWRRA